MAAKKKTKSKKKPDNETKPDLVMEPEGMGEASEGDTSVLATKKEQLYVRLGDPEILTRGREMATLCTEIVAEQEAHKARARERRERIADMQEKRNELAKSVCTGLEKAEVDIQEVAHFDRGEVLTVRMDTNRVIGRRTMTAEERQLLMEAAE